MKKYLLIFLLFLFPLTTYAAQPLPPDQAFAFSTHFANKNTLIAEWKIAPGYYLYRDYFNFRLLDSNTHPQLGKIILPAGIPKQDEILGKYQVYENDLVIPVPIENIHPGKFALVVGYQGCASSGFCYPPVTKQVMLTFTLDQSKAEISEVIPSDTATQSVQTPDRIQTLLASQNWFLILISFLGFGLLLVFTPCVLPLLPILVGIIVGQRNLTGWNAFKLSLSYVLGMSVAYAIAGVFAAIAGSYLQAALQSKIVIIIFSLVFVALALSLFGLYEIRLPSRFQENVTALSNQQKSGTYIGTFIMGVLSILIVSPCVTPALVGALTYIANSRDTILGGLSLFFMGIGMGIPLLIVGTTGGKFLPKAGAWLNAVKIIFGILLLIAAAWMLDRVFPVAELFHMQTQTASANFQTIKSVQDLDHAIDTARQQQKPILLDFYADWCVSCKIMDRNVFSKPEIKEQLTKYILLRADVTANDAQDKELEKTLNVIAPPTIIFFNSQGQEIKEKRIIGELNAEAFSKYLK